MLNCLGILVEKTVDIVAVVAVVAVVVIAVVDRIVVVDATVVAVVVVVNAAAAFEGSDFVEMEVDAAVVQLPVHYYPIVKKVFVDLAEQD